MTDTARPNIIFINTDQQRYDTIAALGFPYMNTPNLDRLFNEGVTFSNCFITASSCAPTRASLFSGLYAHNHGVLRNGSRWPRIWVEDLADAGYHCVNVGKMHTMPYEASMGFHERFVVENKERSSDPDHPEWNPQGPVYVDEQDKAFTARGLEKPGKTFYRAMPGFEELQGSYVWPAPEELHSDFFVGDAVIDWIGRNPSIDKPLFLEIGFPGPHPPTIPSSATSTSTWTKISPSRRPPKKSATTSPGRSRIYAIAWRKSSSTPSPSTPAPLPSSATASAPTTWLTSP